MNRLQKIYADIQTAQRDIEASGLSKSGYRVELVMSHYFLERVLFAEPGANIEIRQTQAHYLLGVPLTLCVKCRHGYKVVITEEAK